MTCIVGMVEGGRVWIGGDSAGVSGLTLQVRADEKVFRNGPFVMGFTSSFRMGQLLRYAFRPPAHPEGVDELQFMATLFVDEARRCLKEGGVAKKADEVESGGTFLVGYRGRIFYVEDDYQVGEMRDAVAACGSGSDVALGAMHVLRTDANLDPAAKLVLALEAAERWNAAVRAPFVVVGDAEEGD